MTDPTENSNRVLIVDDDEGIRQSLARILRSNGHVVEVAKDGFEAIETARQFNPDLLVIDIRMPGIDGVETFQRLRQESPGLTAIFMTAYAASERSDAASESGAITVMNKPLDVPKLLALVSDTLKTAPILVAEDDPDLLRSIARALEANDIEVESVTTLRAALEALRRRPHRVVIADVYLEDGFGYQLLEEVDARDDQTPVILISGKHDWLSKDEAKKLAGRAICLYKPLNIDELVRRITQ